MPINKSILIYCVAVLVFGAFALGAEAAVNEQINYQGKLTDSNNVAVSNGGKCLKFRLMDSLTAGSELWLEEWLATTTYNATTTSGLFSVLLGSIQSLSSVDFNQTLYLEVQYDPGCDFDYEEVFSPRKTLGAVPAAFEAKKLGGYTTSSFAILADNETITGAWTFANLLSATTTAISTTDSATALTVTQRGTGKIVLATSTSALTATAFQVTNLGSGNSFLVEDEDTDASPFVITASGDVGVATTTPRYKLDVWGDIGFGTSTNTNTPALYVDSGDGGRIGIGTTTLSTNLLTVGTTTPSLVVANNGYVGIGTTTPNYKLGVVGSVDATSGYRFGPSPAYIDSETLGIAVYGGYLYAAGSGVSLYVLNTANFRGNIANDNASYLTIAGGTSGYTYFSGNVGIGTTTPRYTLDVWGDLAIGTSTGTNVPALYVQSGQGGRVGIGTTTLSTNLLTVGTTTPALFVDGAGNLGVNGVTYSWPSSQGAASTYLQNDGAGALTWAAVAGGSNTWGWIVNGSVMYSTSTATTIGISTTTPRYLLDVWGDLAVGTSTGTNIPALYVDSGNGGRVGIGTTTLAGLLTVGTSTPSLVVDPAGNVILTQSSGRVGIGTTTPAILDNALTVAGNIKATEKGLFGNLVLENEEGLTLRTISQGSYGFGTTTGGAYYLALRSGTNNAYYTNFSFDTAASGNGNPYGITYYNGFFWIVDVVDAEVYQYNTNGTYTNLHFDTAASGNGSASCITYYNGFFWITDNSDAEVYQYNTNGTYANFSFDTAASGNGAPVGITYYNGFFWIVDNSDAEVYRYNTNGTYANFSFDTAASGNGAPVGITYYNGFFWIVDNSDAEVYQYNTGIYTGGYLTFSANGAESMRIDSTGSVGIATTSPRGKLDVWGNIAIGTSTAGKYGDSSGTTTPALYVLSGNGGQVGIGTTTLAGLLTVGTSTPSLVVNSNGNVFLVQSAGNVGIATTSPRYKLDVWGDLAIGTSTVTGTGQVPALYIDSGDGGRVGIGTTTLAGLLTVGTSTPALVVAPNGYVGIGTTTPNNLIQVKNLINFKGDNTALGYQAGNSITSGIENIALGYQAGNSIATARENIAIGYQALYSVAGNYNVAVGSQSLYSNTGTSNTALGGFALLYTTGDYNTGLGYSAGYGVSGQSTFSNAVSIGYQAGKGLTSGGNNILLGYKAGDALTSGANNIIIGYDIDAPSNTGSNQLSIGNLIFGTSINGTGTTVSSGNVGIGTTTPRYKLDVWGDIGFGTSTVTGTGQVPALYIDSGEGGRVGIGTTTLAGLFTVGTSTPALVVAPNGYVGIASSTPSDTFAVQGNILGVGNIVISGTVDTGQGATEVYLMNQNLQTTNNVTFADLIVTYGISAATTTITATSTLASVNADSGLLYVDAYVDRVGIGTTTPSALLELWTSTADTNLLEIGTSTEAALLIVDSSGNIVSEGSIYQDTYGSDDGLVLYLPFSEGMTSSSASIAYDRSPYGNDGTLTNFPMPGANATSGSGWSTTTCKAGACLTFDGGNDYVNLGNLNAQGTFDAQKDWTISVWVKVDTYNQQGGIFSNRYADTEVIRIATYVDGRLVVATRDSSDNMFYCYMLSATNTDWHYIAVTRQYGGNQVCYLDGKVHTTQADNRTGDFQSETGSDWYLGRVIWSEDYVTWKYFDGTIDEARVYNRALSADEVRAHYLRGGDAHGAVLADKFRIIGTDNNIDFQVVNGTTTIVNGLVVDTNSLYVMADTGYVGIGTTTPRYKLDVWGDLAVGTSTATGTGQAPALYIDSGDGGRVGIGTTTLAGLFTVGTSTPSLVVDPQGYVGIGTTTPASLLTVGTTGAGFQVNSLGNIVSIRGVTYSWPSSQGAASTVLTNDSSGNLTWAAASGGSNTWDWIVSGSVMYSTSSAATIGISTTTPRYTLDVWGDLAVGTSTGTGTGQVPALYIDSGEGGRIGIGTTTLAGLLTVGTSTPALVVAPNGYVGIASSTPSDTFAVQGNILGVGNIVVSGTIDTGQGATEVYLMNQNLQTTNNVTFADLIVTYGISAATTTITATSTLASINADSGLLYVDAYVDRVGIATTTPRYKLDVWGDLAVGTSTDTYTPIFFVDTGSSGVGIGTTTLSTNLLTVGTTTPALVVASNGYVGIATSTPSFPFSVQGTSFFSATTTIASDLVVRGATKNVATKIVAASSTQNLNARADYVCDGTNDQQEIQQALNSLPASGGIVYLLEGTYNIGSTTDQSYVGINITQSSTTLAGAGASTILKRVWDATADKGVITVGDGGTAVSSVVITNLSIDGRKATYAGTENIGIYFNQKVTQSRIQNTWVRNNDGVGIYLYSETDAASNSYNLIEGNDVRDNDSWGIYLRYSSDNIISENSFQGNDFVYLIASNRNIISENSIRSSTRDGLYIQSSANNVITSNIIYEVAGGSYDGIFLVLADNNIISSNRIIDSSGSRYGINVSDSGSDNNYFIGNEISGAGFTAEINDAGTGTTIQQRDIFEIETSLSIGTSTARYKLDVWGDIGFGTSTVTGTGQVPALYVDSGDGGRIGIGTTTLAGLLTVGTTTPALVVAPNGRVGIGTTGPNSKLDVNGLLLISGVNTPTAGAGVSIYYSASVGNIDSYDWGAATRKQLNIHGDKIGLMDGNVGIATTTPRYLLDVWGDMAVGTSTGTNVPALYVDSGNGGRVGIGTTTLAGLFTVGTSTPALVVNSNGNVFLTQSSGNVGIGTTTPYSKLTINESNDFAFGDFNASTVDTMEGNLGDWHSSNPVYVGTSTESTIVKTGGRALKIYASTTPEDVVVRKIYSSPQNFSASMERLGFWIYADQIATSSATTTQIISVGIYSSTNAGNATSTKQIYIQSEDRWQYEEWTISGLLNATSVDELFFRIDVNNISTTTFYIDQIRLYNSTERSGEMFVGKDGSLTIMGAGAVEIGRAAGSSNLPGIKVDTAVVEFNQPVSVNTGGDVGMDYDLQFLNTGLSQITSEGPLRIAAGDSNHSENLTLTTGGTGDVIVELSASSSAFIVTHAWAASTTVPFIINSESNSTTTPEIDKLGILFQVISDYSTDENTVFSIDASGNIYYDRGAHTPAADVAENYYIEDDSIVTGDVVCLSENSSLTVEKCSSAYEPDLIGVISTRPALLMAADFERARPVALAGRVPVKVSDENGPIQIGDALTSASSTPGAAMKAIGAGKILGYALEEYNPNATNTDSNSTNQIYAFINLQDRSSGDLTVFQNTEGTLEVRTLTQNGLTALFSIDDEGALVVDKIKTKQLCVGSVCVTENEFMKVFGAGAAGFGDVGLPQNPISGSPTSTDSVCENGVNRPCSTEVGACQIGIEVCEAGHWGSCIGAVLPQDEICDEVDNDCDGETDEGDICGNPISPTSEASSPQAEPIIETPAETSTTTATTTNQ